MSEAAGERVNERILRLDFECLQSLPEGINEVRVWYDNLLECSRVGKRIDISAISSRDVLPEAATLQSINHDHVVPVLAAARVSGYSAPMQVVELVTPYYERGSVTDALLRGETFTATQAVRVTQAVLRGLGALHEIYGICHRDMKSGNVLLTTDRHVAKVADLGLAGKFDGAGEVPALENPTPYSPRELVATGRLTRASDIYAVGLILRELLGGPFPYDKYTTTTTAESLLANRCPISKVDLALPIWASRSMRRIYNKATRPAAKERFQTAWEMDAALTRAVAIDWSSHGDDRWEAPFTHQAKRVAVVGRSIRGGKLRLSTLVQGQRWQRVAPDLDVEGWTSNQAGKVFDHASDIASAR